MLTLALLTPLALLQGTPTGDVEAALDELIARTNALAGFSAEYALESSTGATGSLFIDYAAPDRARFMLRAEEFGGFASTWSVDGEFCLIAPREDGVITYARVEVPTSESAALAALHERFQRPPEREGELEPGPQFVWDMGYDEASDRVSLDTSLIRSRLPRATLLMWLRSWRNRPELIERTADALVMTHARFGGTIPLATGFPSELWLIGKDGEERRIRLVSLSLEEEDDDGRFTLPPLPEGAVDRSEELARAFGALATARAERMVCIECIEDLLGRDRVEWGEPVREDARAVFVALHDPWLAELGEQATEQLRPWVENYAAWLSAQLDDGRTGEELREHVERTWQELAARNVEAREGWLQSFRSEAPPVEDSDDRARLLALEAEVFAALYLERLERPGRELYGEATRAVLDRSRP